MKTDLKYLLNRNKISIKQFLKINNINSFLELQKYCKSRNISCLLEDEYSAIVNEDKETKSNSPEKPKRKYTKRNTKRRTGKTQKK